MSFKRFLIGLFIIGILVATGAGIWYWQRNVYSKEILKLEIIGPSKAELAEEVTYTVKYKNNGTIRLENPKLIFEYPEHTVMKNGGSRKEIELEEIYPGQEKTMSFEGRLFGSEGQIKTAKALLSFRPKNLKARYESETTFNTVVEEVPLTFRFELPSKAKPEEDISFNLNYYSNVDYPLSDLRINTEYPSGFEFKNAEPSGLSDHEWDIGLLNQAEGGRIQIEGNLKGELQENKIFKAELGTYQDGEFVLLKKAARGVKITEPSLYISQEINGSPKYTAEPGETLHYEIYFKNIGDQAFSELFLVSNLEGKGFDFESWKSSEGEFQPGDNSIIFDWKRVPKLELLDSGEEGKIEFWIDVKENWNSEREPTLVNRVRLDQASKKFTTKVNAGLKFAQEGYFNNEVFHNTGPIPPEVGESTQYVIMWKAQNKFNEIENAKVKATLPSYVEPTGKIFPEEEKSKFAFDSSSGEVVWDLEDMKKEGEKPNITFQVKFTSTSSQEGETPEIISEAKFTGTDKFTEEKITATSSSVTTSLEDDDTIEEGQGIVQ